MNLSVHRRHTGAFAQAFLLTTIVSASPSALAQPSSGLLTSSPKPLPICPPLPLSQSLPRKAYELYLDAHQLHNAADYKGAVAIMGHAYSLSSDPRLLLEQAIWEWHDLHRYARARRLVELFLEDNSCMITPESRRIAEVMLAKIKRHVSPLYVLTQPPGATIIIDGNEVGQSPMRIAIDVQPGEHNVTVSKDGYEKSTKSVTTAGDELVVIQITLKRQAPDGWLEVNAEPKGSHVLVDGQMVGKTPWKGRVAAGSHSLLVEATGMQPDQREITVQKGQRRQIQISLTPEWQRWVWLGAGAALLTTGIALAVGLKPYSDQAIFSGSVQTFIPSSTR